MKKAFVVMLFAAIGCGEQSFTKTKAILFCREIEGTNDATIAILTKQGWRYAGALHNDGINCTKVLWECRDSSAPCARD